MILLRLVAVLAAAAVLLAPAWWLAGRLVAGPGRAFWRLLWAAGLALVGYLSVVNLAGRAAHHSTGVAAAWLALNAVAAVVLWWRQRAESSWAPLVAEWRGWAAPLALAVVLAVPQAVLAIGTNYYDEAASSAIHLTAPNQFAEGVFPPRHNALPDVVIKYHYGFTILSGTVRWLTGLPANSSVDLASTLLWLFAFLFVFWWLRELGAGTFARVWGAVAVLFGGGLAWLYLPRIEAYSGIAKLPTAGELLHRWDPAEGWLANLLASGRVPALHLRNGDGSLSNLPWDIAAQFQQHAVALGLALTLFCLAAFVAWQRERDGLRGPYLAVVVASFGVLTLGHAAFGAMAALAGGLWLLGSWLRHRTRDGFLRGVAFGGGVGGLALLHGGLFARGAQYGGNDVATLRESFGYSAGGVPGFLHWNLAGFGIPLLLALAAWVLHRARRATLSEDARLAFGLLTVLTAASWLLPHLVFYSSDTIGVEQYTEISKFFFISRLGFALLSAFGAWYLVRAVPWPVLAPALPAMAVVPLAFIVAASRTAEGTWIGFYRSPYFVDSIEQQMGEALARMKDGPRATYFDASADERHHGYLGEMLIFGGSTFTLTPSRYERTGIGYRLAEDVIARRLMQNGRMARLQPGAPEECGCSWYYLRPVDDMTLAPLLVRSRFAQLVAEGYLTRRAEAGARALYSIDRPTAGADSGLARFWQPRIVTQSSHPGPVPLVFLDRTGHRLVGEGGEVPLPEAWRGESLQLYTGRFPGDPRVRFLAGRMEDTEFRLGKRIEDIVEQSRWRWTFLDPDRGAWQPEAALWLWDWELPFIADLDGDGVDSQLAFRPRGGVWSVAPGGQALAGPATQRADLPLPFGGRFLEGSRGDLGAWNLRAGTVTLRSVGTDRTVTFRWGGREGDVLVPGDYDGDGVDEIAVWQRTNQVWYWRRAPDGPIGQATFGTATSVPVPADYNGDGRLDLAYWEPGEGRIYVSLTQGGRVDRVIEVPPGTIPAWVNWL